MSSKDTATTTVTPSAFDESKAKTVNQLRELLFPAMTPQLSGSMTSKSQEGMEASNFKGLTTAAGSGVERGNDALLSSMATGRGDKSSALNMALQLYGYQPMTQASTATKSSGANAAGKTGAGVNAARTAYNLGKELYDWYNQPTNTPFEYQPLPEPTITPNAAPTVNPYALPDYGMAPTAEMSYGGYGAGQYTLPTLSSYGAIGAGADAAAGSYGVLASDIATEATAGQSIYDIIAGIFAV